MRDKLLEDMNYEPVVRETTLHAHCDYFLIIFWLLVGVKSFIHCAVPIARMFIVNILTFEKKNERFVLSESFGWSDLESQKILLSLLTPLGVIGTPFSVGPTP